MTGTLFDAAVDVRTCRGCGVEKPVTEFYRRQRNGTSTKRLGKCRDCDNSRSRARSIARVVRARARHRATAELLRRHDPEFRLLLEHFTEVVATEAQQLASAPQAQDVYGPTDPVRLRSGPRREGEDAEDRIDLTRCPQCISHHSRGHVCANCGSAPESVVGIGDEQPLAPPATRDGICACGHAGGRHDDEGWCKICSDCAGYQQAVV